MERKIHKLTAAKIRQLTEPKWHPDGNGLYLRVRSASSRSWIFRFMYRGKARMMGLGSADVVTLAQARELALEQRRLLAGGIDPVREREAAKRKTRGVTFAEAAQQYIDSQSRGWKNAKHHQQWINTLRRYAYPVIGPLTVEEIDTDHIRKILDDIWYVKPETASRVRGRIEAVLGWAKVLKLRSGDNPALWRGHLVQIYRPRSEFRPVEHQKMLPWRETPGFYQELRDSPLLGARPLMLAILTAARRNDIVQVRWNQIDLDAEIPMWTVPANALKGRKGNDHRVPLADAAVELLRSIAAETRPDRGYVFQGRKEDTSISGETMRSAIAKLGYGGKFTQHGFRRSFRSWAAERTKYPREIVETALAHENPNKVEAAYLDSDFFEKRYPLMQDWSDFLEGKGAAEIVSFAKRA